MEWADLQWEKEIWRERLRFCVLEVAEMGFLQKEKLLYVFSHCSEGFFAVASGGSNATQHIFLLQRGVSGCSE